jgi:hypothetical protein
MVDEDTVQALVERAAAAGVAVDVHEEAHAVNMAGEVVRIAGAVDASVIVIGLRKRPPVGKLLMGSTTQRILLDVDRPVLAVKPWTARGTTARRAPTRGAVARHRGRLRGHGGACEGGRRWVSARRAWSWGAARPGWCWDCCWPAPGSR